MRRPLPPNLAKVTSIDRNNPSAHSVSLIWADAALTINNFDLAVLGKVDATQGDLLTNPPRGWVTLHGECRRRIGSYIKLK